MIIDCGRCDRRLGAQPARCQGCLVTVLCDTPAGIADLMPAELAAIELFELAGFEVELLDPPAAPVVVPIYRPTRQVA